MICATGNVVLLWKTLLHLYSLHLCKRSVKRKCMDLPAGSPVCSIGLCVCFCANTTPFWLLWLCNTLWNKEIWCFQICSSLLLQLNNKNEMTQLKMGKRPKYTVLKWRHKQVNRYMKKCSSSLIMRECKSKPQWDRTSCLLEWLVSKRQ